VSGQQFADIANRGRETALAGGNRQDLSWLGEAKPTSRPLIGKCRGDPAPRARISGLSSHSWLLHEHHSRAVSEWPVTRPEYAETADPEQNNEAATIADFSLMWFPGTRASCGDLPQPDFGTRRGRHEKSRVLRKRSIVSIKQLPWCRTIRAVKAI
jgi:hypothetical protein